MLTNRDALLSNLGSPYTNQVVERFHRFAYVPTKVLEKLAAQSLNEEWGKKSFVLQKYLAVHVPWSIEQERFTMSDNQFYTTAGHLQTRYGTPVYLAFERNKTDPTVPWVLTWAGAALSAPELPTSPDLPASPSITPGVEIVMMHDHILGENADRVPFLKGTPPVAQMCAVAGAIQWSLNRGLQIAYWYYGRMSYLVPLYLQSREDITRAPDLIAPIQVAPESLIVRTVMPPHMPYANARVAVRRHDQLPSWMNDAWKLFAGQVSEQQIEEPEPQPPASGVA
jgi:Domain of unknown function (DUF3825)